MKLEDLMKKQTWLDTLLNPVNSYDLLDKTNPITKSMYKTAKVLFAVLLNKSAILIIENKKSIKLIQLRIDNGYAWSAERLLNEGSAEDIACFTTLEDITIKHRANLDIFNRTIKPLVINRITRLNVLDIVDTVKKQKGIYYKYENDVVINTYREDFNKGGRAYLIAKWRF